MRDRCRSAVWLRLPLPPQRLLQLDHAAVVADITELVVPSPSRGGGAAGGRMHQAPAGGAPAAASPESVVTQVTAADAQPVAEKGGGARRRPLLARLASCCCGAGPAEEGAELSDRPQSRIVFIPPAPHTGAAFIGPLGARDTGRKTLVLDLDETLVHSSFKPVPNPDYVIPVEIDGKVRTGRSGPLVAPACWSPARVRHAVRA